MARCVRLFFVFIALACSAAHAHKASDSYLTLTANAQGVSGHWDIALRDLDAMTQIDSNDNGEITWREVRTAHPQIARVALDNLRLQQGDTRCTLSAGEQTLVEHTDGAYTRIPLTSPCVLNANAALAVGYTLLQNIDPQHRGMLALTHFGETSTRVLNPNDSAADAARAQPSFLSFVSEGIHHILIGIDHVLFVALLVAAAVRTQPGSLRAALWPLAQVVTAFTIAHSLTLALAVFGWVNLPSRWIETLIAASVCVCALDIVRPFLKGPRWVLAFCFGLLHGLGLASALTALSLPASERVLALLGFNVGVEIGQLAIALAAFALLYAASRITRNPLTVARFAAVPIAAVAMVWMLERSLDTKWLPL
jgi:hypothetical protein